MSDFITKSSSAQFGAFITVVTADLTGEPIWEEWTDEYQVNDFLEAILRAIPECLYETAGPTIIHQANDGLCYGYEDTLEWLSFARDSMCIRSACYDTIDNNFGWLYGVERLDGRYDGDDPNAYNAELDETYEYNPYEGYVTESFIMSADGGDRKLEYINVKVNTERVVGMDNHQIYRKDIDYHIDYTEGHIARLDGSKIGETELVTVIYDTTLSDVSEWVRQEGEVVILRIENPPAYTDLLHSNLQEINPSTFELYDWTDISHRYVEGTDFTVNYADGSILVLNLPESMIPMTDHYKVLAKYFYRDERQKAPPDEEIREKDNRYRNRLIHFVDAVNQGCTETGMQKLVRAVSRRTSKVHEGYKSMEARTPGAINWREELVWSNFGTFGSDECSGLMWVPMETTIPEDWYDIHAEDSSNILTVGRGGNMGFYNGTSWESQDSGTGENLYAVDALDAGNVWVVGDNGTILYGNGSSWAQQTVSPADKMTDGEMDQWSAGDLVYWTLDPRGDVTVEEFPGRQHSGSNCACVTMHVKESSGYLIPNSFITINPNNSLQLIYYYAHYSTMNSINVRAQADLICYDLNYAVLAEIIGDMSHSQCNVTPYPLTWHRGVEIYSPASFPPETFYVKVRFQAHRGNDSRLEGEYGQIFFDSASLKEIGIPTLYGVCAIAANNIIAVGTIGAGAYITKSADGTTWAEEAPGTEDALRAVDAADSSHIFAVGDYGTILFSPDGATWTSQNSWTEATLTKINCLGNMDMVACGHTPGVVLHYDGVDWTILYEDSSAVFYGLYAMDDDNFVVGGRYGSQPIIMSFHREGSTWSYGEQGADPNINIKALTGLTSSELYGAGDIGSISQLTEDYAAHMGQFKTSDYPLWHHAKTSISGCDSDHPTNRCYWAFDNNPPEEGAPHSVTWLTNRGLARPPCQYIAVHWPKGDERRYVFYQTVKTFSSPAPAAVQVTPNGEVDIVEGTLVVSDSTTGEVYAEGDAADYTVDYGDDEIQPVAGGNMCYTTVDVSLQYMVHDDTPQFDYLKIVLDAKWRVGQPGGAFISIYGLGSEAVGDWYDITPYASPLHGDWEWKLVVGEYFTVGKTVGTEAYYHQLKYGNVRAPLTGREWEVISLTNADTGEVYKYDASWVETVIDLSTDHYHISDATDGTICIHKKNADAIPPGTTVLIDYQYLSEAPISIKRGAWFHATTNPVHLANGVSSDEAILIPVRNFWYSGLKIVFHYPEDVGPGDLTDADDIGIRNIYGIRRMRDHGEVGLARFSILPDLKLDKAEMNYINGFVQKLKPAHTEHAIDQDCVMEEVDVNVEHATASSEYILWLEGQTRMRNILDHTSDYRTDHLDPVPFNLAWANPTAWTESTVIGGTPGTSKIVPCTSNDFVVGPVGSSNDVWGLGQNCHGHTNTMAKDSSTDTFWLSVGHRSGNSSSSFEWVEFDINQHTPWVPLYNTTTGLINQMPKKGPAPAVNRIKIWPVWGGTVVYISLGSASKGWLGSAYLNGYNPEPPARANSTNLVPYLVTANLNPANDMQSEIHLPWYEDIIRMRLTFHNLANTSIGEDAGCPDGRYRASLREVWLWEEHNTEIVTSKGTAGRTVKTKYEKKSVERLIDGNLTSAWISDVRANPEGWTHAWAFFANRSTVNRATVTFPKSMVGAKFKLYCSRWETGKKHTMPPKTGKVSDSVDDKLLGEWKITKAKMSVSFTTAENADGLRLSVQTWVYDKKYSGYCAKVCEIQAFHKYSTYDHPPELTIDAYRAGGFTMSWLSMEHPKKQGAYDTIDYDIGDANGDPSLVNRVRLYAPWAGQSYDVYLKSPYVSVSQEVVLPESISGAMHPTMGTKGWVQLRHPITADDGTVSWVDSTNLRPFKETVTPWYDPTGGEGQAAFETLALVVYDRGSSGTPPMGEMLGMMPSGDYEIDYALGLIRRRPDRPPYPNSRIIANDAVWVMHFFSEEIGTTSDWDWVGSKTNAEMDDSVLFPGAYSTQMRIKFTDPFYLPAVGGTRKVLDGYRPTQESLFYARNLMSGVAQDIDTSVEAQFPEGDQVAVMLLSRSYPVLAGTVVVTSPGGNVTYEEGEDADYIINYPTAQIERVNGSTHESSIPDGASVNVSFKYNGYSETINVGKTTVACKLQSSGDGINEGSVRLLTRARHNIPVPQDFIGPMDVPDASDQPYVEIWDETSWSAPGWAGSDFPTDLLAYINMDYRTNSVYVNVPIGILSRYEIQVEYEYAVYQNVPIPKYGDNWNSCREGYYFACYEACAYNAVAKRRWMPANVLDKQTSSFWKSEESEMGLVMTPPFRTSASEDHSRVATAREEWLKLELTDDISTGYPPVVDKFLILSDTNVYKFRAEYSMDGDNWQPLEIKQMDIGGASLLDETDPYDNDYILRSGTYHFERRRMKFLMLTFNAYAQAKRKLDKYFVAVREISPFGSRPAGRDIERWFDTFPDEVYVDEEMILPGAGKLMYYNADVESLEATPTLTHFAHLESAAHLHYFTRTKTMSGQGRITS